jgi:hypothetical protein
MHIESIGTEAYAIETHTGRKMLTIRVSKGLLEISGCIGAVIERRFLPHLQVDVIVNEHARQDQGISLAWIAAAESSGL